MFKRVKLLLAFVSLAISLSIMSTTYSRYVADTIGNVELSFAKWQILVSNIDITSNYDSTISFEPTIEENEFVAANVMAPSSKGYFDIDIDPTFVDVSFRYNIDLNISNDVVLDLDVTKYAILPDNYVEGDPLEFTDLDSDVITNTMFYNKDLPLFRFKPFTIRVYFEWFEGEGELMDDESDTLVGHLAATEDLTFSIDANISFEQIIEDEEVIENELLEPESNELEELITELEELNETVINEKQELNEEKEELFDNEDDKIFFKPKNDELEEAIAFNKENDKQLDS